MSKQDQEEKEQEENGEEDEDLNTPNMVKEAQKAAERLETANKKTETLVQRLEALNVESTLGGKSEASGTMPQPKEETDLDYANKVLAGDVNAKAE